MIHFLILWVTKIKPNLDEHWNISATSSMVMWLSSTVNHTCLNLCWRITDGHDQMPCCMV